VNFSLPFFVFSMNMKVTRYHTRVSEYWETLKSGLKPYSRSMAQTLLWVFRKFVKDSSSWCEHQLLQFNFWYTKAM
jgi:hypothetical protein